MSFTADVHNMLREYAEDGRHRDVLTAYAGAGKIPWVADRGPGSPAALFGYDVRVTFCRNYVLVKVPRTELKMYDRADVLRWAGIEPNG